MTQPANTFDSYDAIGKQEDLSNIIFNIAPTDTPFLSGCGKTTATNTLYEWQTDTLTAVADNKAVEGDDIDANAVTPTVRLNNYTQISRKAVSIPGTLEAVNRAGRKSEMAYQIALRGKELKRDMEYALVGINNARAVGNSTTARELASVQAWINTNTSAGTNGADPTGDGTDARTDGTQRAFTEELLKDVLQSVWSNSGSANALKCMLGAFNKRVASGFTGSATRFDNSEDKKLVAAIDVYVSDWGEVTLVPNRFLRTRDALVLNMDYWKIAYLRDFQTDDLAKTGDATRKMLLVEYTLEASNEAASGIVADLTTS